MFTARLIRRTPDRAHDQSCRVRSADDLQHPGRILRVNLAAHVEVLRVEVLRDT